MTIRSDAARARTPHGPKRGPGPAQLPSRRREAISLSSVNVVAGLWLIFSPWVLGFTEEPIWNNLILGGAITLFAVARVSRVGWPSFTWINLLVGAWVFATGFWLYDSSTGGWNSVIVGGVVMLFSVWSAAASDDHLGRPTATPPQDGI